MVLLLVVVVQGNYEDGKYDTVAIQGNDITLSISSDLQAYGEKLMANKVGAVVAIEPSSGEVLAMVSMPTYDPQLMVGRVRGKNYDSLLKAPYKPLLNRAVSSTYPPGSTFKVAQALVALQEGVITPNQSFPCDKSKVGCHNHPTPTSVSMGIQMSCNPYFYFVFRRLVQRGIDKNLYKDAAIGLGLWKEKIETLGFNHAFNVGVPGVNRSAGVALADGKLRFDTGKSWLLHYSASAEEDKWRGLCGRNGATGGNSV